VAEPQRGRLGAVVAARDRLLLRARFGDLRRTEGVDGWGFGRGTPVDRWYIERYLDGCAPLVHGHCLEVQDDVYGTKLGADRVTVLDIDPDNPKADLVGDLCDPQALPHQGFDTAIVTQTLQLVADPAAAVAHLVAALRPGGTLLVTAPVVSRLAGDVDRWRWTPRGLRELLEAAAPDGAQVETTGMGNGLAGRAFLFGLAAEDLDDDVLQVTEPRYPIVVGAQVRLRA
jgi:SAM-dependent methyltransferase